jgi:hypothetical protein
MLRRHFLPTLAFPGARLLGQAAGSPEVTKVHVIFKTHLDVGFTDLAANVLRTYHEQFIPAVLDLTERQRREGAGDRNAERYIWTTGSWLLYNFLESASPENRRRMEQAIEAGDFVWHAVPFTTHTELIDPSLYRLGLEWSARLDRRFGRKTISAKMTDVPGHTRSAVSLLAAAGVRLLHIGVNAASHPPMVPPLFAWSGLNGVKVKVMYHTEYGGVTVLPGGQSAVSVSFTGDNHGPHTPAQIAAIYAGLRKRFPKAQVLASDFNAVAREIDDSEVPLPVVTQEIGDTWIHGPGSDPLRMAEFRELSRLRREWIEAGKLEANSDADLAFGGRLLPVAEHTWGLDVKTWLKHWDVWDMPAFRAARHLDEFKRIEASWNEKRAYIANAVSALPQPQAVEARRRLAVLRAVSNDSSSVPATSERAFETAHFNIGFDRATGAVSSLVHRGSGREWAGRRNPLGLFAYQTFSKADFDRFLSQYLVRKPDWAFGDFGKPGLENTAAKSATYTASALALRTRPQSGGHLFVSELAVPRAGDSGCPQRLALEVLLPMDRPEVRFTLRCASKPASRLPEALWLSFAPRFSLKGRVDLDKMGQVVSPLNVVPYGNRHLHGVTAGLKWIDGDQALQLDALDAFLVAPGRRTLLEFDNRPIDIAAGMHFCLFNNVWGTNFTMWFEDDMLYRFVLRC